MSIDMSTARPRLIYVTGAASGIGLAVAKSAANRGWNVGLLDLHRPDIELSSSMRFEYCDVSDARSLDTAAELLADHWPKGPDAVVHCAGVYRTGDAVRRDEDLFDTVTRINAKGSFLASSTLCKSMLRNGSGSLVLLSSIAYLLGDPTEPGAAYAASKGAVVSLGRQLAAEWGHLGVRTNIVAPGVIETPMTTIVDNVDAHRQLLSTIPSKRLGRPEEVAEVCLFLASERSSYVNGAVIPVDGGQTVV